MKESLYRIKKHVENKFNKKLPSVEEIMRKIKPGDVSEGLKISRALAVLRCVSEGMNHKEIAKRLGFSEEMIVELEKYGVELITK